MKDAFGKKIKEGSTVLYSTSGHGTNFYIGKAIRLIPEKETTPDKIEIKVEKSSRENLMTKNPIVHAENVVVL